VFTSLLITCGRPAEQRARTYFAIPPSTVVDSTTLRRAVLQLVPLGTSEPEVARRLAERGIGKDSLSGYFPPDSMGMAEVRIEYDPRSLRIVHRSFGIIMWFDSARNLRDVQVREWLTGP
jgi:hypothetical protein